VKASVLTLGVVVVMVAAVLAGTTSASSSAACTAGQATGTGGCTRAWVAAGCSGLVPLVKAATGAASVTASKVALRDGKDNLGCSFTYGSGQGLGLLFAASGSSAAKFTGNIHNITQFTAGCLASQGGDQTTMTPALPVKSLSGLGDQAAEINECPSGWAWAVSPGQPLDSGNSSAYTSSIVVRRGVTSLQVSGAGSAMARALAFARKLVVAYP
jgi:hypothetical protein